MKIKKTETEYIVELEKSDKGFIGDEFGGIPFSEIASFRFNHVENKEIDNDWIKSRFNRIFDIPKDIINNSFV